MGAVVPVGMLNQNTWAASCSCRSALVRFIALIEPRYRVCFYGKNKEKCDMNLCT